MLQVVTLQVFLALIDCLRFGCVGLIAAALLCMVCSLRLLAGCFGWFCLCLVLTCRYLCFGLVIGICFLG